jgi:hypothetical protein
VGALLPVPAQLPIPPIMTLLLQKKPRFASLTPNLCTQDHKRAAFSGPFAALTHRNFEIVISVLKAMWQMSH